MLNIQRHFVKSIELLEISMAEQSTITRVHRLKQILNRFFSSLTQQQVCANSL